MTDLEFASLLAHLGRACHSALGKLEVQKVAPLDKVEDMVSSQKLIAQFQDALEQGIDFDFTDLSDLDQYFDEGGYDIYDWEEFRELAINADLAVRLCENTEAFKELHLAQKVLKKISGIPEIMQGFNRIYDAEGDVMDSASAELMQIRRRMGSLRSRIHRSMQDMLSEPRLEGFLQDKFVTQREGRFVLPIKEASASYVPGVIQSRSAKGSTLFIEPAEIVPLNNEMQLLKEEEKREIHRILSEFTNFIRGNKRRMLKNQELLSRLDFLYAAARLSNSLRSRVPIMKLEPSLSLRAARHPLLILQKIAAEGKNGYHSVIPFDLKLGIDYKLLILSGPNTGGKTVLMKAVGLITLMAMSGLPVPVDESSEIGCFSAIYADIGDDQSIESALSTFSSHLDKIGKMISKADANSLILIDEIGAATDPQQGSALAQAILERLAELGVNGIVTTHYTALKVFAESHTHCVNASMQFDLESLIPTYHFSIGIPGDSFAIEVAASLGMDPELIARAKSLAGSQNLEFSTLVKTMQEQKKELVRNNYEYQLKTRDLQAKLDELESRESVWEKELKERRKRHLKELQSELLSFQKLYSREIHEIKTLDKEERKRFSERKLQDITKQTEELSRELQKSSVENREKLQKPRAGDKVWLANFEAEAIIMAVQGEKATVDMNGITFKTELDNLYELRESEAKPEPTVHLSRANTSQRMQTELKLLGLTFDEAMPLIDEFLDNAQLIGIGTLRIVHGKGTGALRAKVRDYLSRKKIVKSIETPPPFEGGNGVTVVKL
ncbi:MAG: endonuclease MutS2 [Candidatus Cloacimonetes bacterium]|nr:endonuclease MutS2 [Candidatus Cloacimonadota bacterium]